MVNRKTVYQALLGFDLEVIRQSFRGVCKQVPKPMSKKQAEKEERIEVKRSKPKTSPVVTPAARPHRSDPDTVIKSGFALTLQVLF